MENYVLKIQFLNLQFFLFTTFISNNKKYIFFIIFSYAKKNFYYSFYKIYKKLIDIKIKAINNKLYLVDIYDIIMKNKDLYKEILKINKNIQNDWIEKFKFK